MINKVILIGRLGNDPEVRYTQDGAMVTSFRLATDEHWKDKNGEKQQKTEWHQIVVFGKLAEICGEYLVKGKLVFVEGKLTTKAWEDKNGVKRYTTSVQIHDMKMLDSKRGSAEGDHGDPADIPADMPAAGPMEDVPF